VRGRFARNQFKGGRRLLRGGHRVGRDHGLIALAHRWMIGAASSVPMPERAWQMLIMSALIACLFAYVAVFLAFPSVALTYYVAKRFQIRHIAYYVMCGCLASIAYLPIVLSLLERLAEQRFLIPSKLGSDT
jgi:hypothetical protein